MTTRWSVVVMGSMVHLAVVFLPVSCLAGVLPWSDPACVVFSLGMTALCLADSVRAEGPIRASNRQVDRKARRVAAVSGSSLLCCVWLLLAEHAQHGDPRSWWLVAAGGALMGGGAALRHWAVRSLGPRFVTEIAWTEDSVLVRGGPYRWIRHPSETGLLTAIGGACLILASPAGALVVLGVSVFLAIVRTRLEEGTMRASLGDTFDAYAGAVPPFLPR